MPSFDIVNQVDLQEVDNAVNNTLKEVSTRYDFKGLHTEISFDRKEMNISIVAAEKMKLKAVRDLLIKHFIKRNLKPGILDYGSEETGSLGTVKATAKIQEGIDREKAKKIVKEIKNSGIKVQSAIQDDQIRVSGKKIDDLQSVIQHLKSKNFGIPLQFINMRS